MEKYRKQGMQYRFHDETPPVPKPVDRPQMLAHLPGDCAVDAAPGSLDEPGDVVPADAEAQDGSPPFR